MNVPTPKKLKSGTWYIQMRLGGKSQYVTGLTAKECRDKAELIKSEWNNGKRDIAYCRNITLRQACKQYIKRKELEGKSPETIRGYSIITNNRFQSVMDKPVSSIKNWQTVYLDEAKHLSAKTMKNTWSFIKSAVQNECGIHPPKISTIDVVRREHAFLSPEETRSFVNTAKNDKYSIALYLALCSCRCSEILGLDWEDVDLNKKTIYIHRAVVRDINNKKVDKPTTKTDASTRYIPIFIPELYAALLSVKNKSGKVVVANENTLLEHANAICDKAGLPRVGVHGLRHSFASLAYSLDVPVKVTMQIGGWSDLGTVMKIYTHLSQRDIKKHSGELFAFFENATDKKITM